MCLCGCARDELRTGVGHGQRAGLVADAGAARLQELIGDATCEYMAIGV